jgi:hypothetical protein
MDNYLWNTSCQREKFTSLSDKKTIDNFEPCGLCGNREIALNHRNLTLLMLSPFKCYAILQNAILREDYLQSSRAISNLKLIDKIFLKSSWTLNLLSQI